ISQWLPATIIDAHLHCQFRQNHENMFNPNAKYPGGMFSCFPWSEHREILRKIFGRRIRQKVVLLGFPFSEWEEENNKHLFSLVDIGTRFIPVLTMTAEKSATRVEEMLDRGFSGIKMYPTRAQKSSSTRIIDVFLEEVLGVADKKSLPIILHLPQDIFANLDELIFLAKKFKKISFVVAHMGNVYLYDKRFLEALQKISKVPNVLFDTAMVADPQVLAEALAILGSQRIIYGSDAPFSYIRGRFYNSGVGIRLQSQVRFNWVDPLEYQQYRQEAKDFKLMHIRIIMAIGEAMQLSATRNVEEAKNNIFCSNAQKHFQRR
ncbi:MAG: amidohydrolase family protein, partial [Candidatus Paceibacterota bacterium]